MYEDDKKFAADQRNHTGPDPVSHHGQMSELVESAVPSPPLPPSEAIEVEAPSVPLPPPEVMEAELPSVPLPPPEAIEAEPLPLPPPVVAQVENTQAEEPTAPTQPRQKRRGAKRRRHSSLRTRAIVAILAILLAITAVSSVAYLGTSYDIVISTNSNGLELRLTPRFREEPIIEWPFGGDRDLPPRFPTMEDDDIPDTFDPAPPVVLGDGTTLELQPLPEDRESAQLSFQEIYVKCSPSVVSVEVTIRSGFQYGSGSGVVMTENGYIITNAHVIEDARQVYVVLQDGERFVAAVVGEDMETDIAVLKIDAAGLPPAAFGNSDLLQIGEEVAVIGNPLGQLHSMSNGIISALDREITHEGITMRLIQTNAAINEGNSGGPLINRYGQVVGITNMKLVGGGWFSATVEGMGFAIPTTTIKPVVDAIIAHGHVPGRPSIGIIIRTVEAPEAAASGIEPGLYVESVSPGTDAAAQGLSPGDRILAFNGRDISTAFDLREQIRGFQAGDTIRLTIERNGRTMDLDIMLMDSAALGN